MFRQSIFILVIVAIASCGQTGGSSSPGTTADSAVKNEQSFAVAKEPYLHLEGKIGDIPVMMDLTAVHIPEDEHGTNSSNYSGYYYYTSQDKPISLNQTDTVQSSAMTLKIWTENEADVEIFSGTYQNGVYKGTWSKGKTSLPFELIKVTSGFTEITHLSYGKRIPAGVKTEEGEEIADDISFDWFVPKDEALQKEVVEFVSDTQYSSFDNYSRRLTDTIEKEYIEEIKEYLKDTSGFKPGYSWNHAYGNSVYPVVNSKDYLVLLTSYYTYDGGAHGLSGESFFTYRKSSGKWLKLQDVLNLQYKKEINKVLDRRVRELYKIPEGVLLSDAEEGGFISDSIFVTHNFTLDKKGISFHYGLYEMTAYAYGFFELFVPYDRLKPFLNKDFKY